MEGYDRIGLSIDLRRRVLRGRLSDRSMKEDLERRIEDIGKEIRICS